jgi:Flp pilus assembly protein TadD
VEGSLAPDRLNRFAALLALVTVLAAVSAAPGCASLRGARLYQTGTRALETGDTDRALAELQEAVRLVPHGSEIHNHLGLAWLAAGDEGRALEAFEHAVALDCDNRAASRNLVRLEEQVRERAIERVSRSQPAQ